MCPVERRTNERAMHETFLVIKASPADMGSRPLVGPFASPDLTVGPDGRPKAVVWNLGTREVRGVTTEFAYIPAGMPISPENKRVIGMGNPANILANSSVFVGCNGIWPRTSPADVLVVTAYHPELDPIKSPCDPIHDRHVGQMNYAWSGVFEGSCPGPSGGKVSIHIRAANQGLYKVRVFQAISGRLPSNPQVERTMAPTGDSFRWQQSFSFKKEIWEFTVLDNKRILVGCKAKYTDQSGRADFSLGGTLTRQ